MAASDIDRCAFIYKRMYSDDQVGEQVLRDHTLSELVTKKTGLGGEDFRYIVRYGNPQGVSGDFATAQSGAASSKGIQFACEPALKYGVITIDGPSMARARGKEQAFFDLVTMETDGILEELGDSLAFDLFRNGTGVRGRRSSASTNVITLTVPDDARNFKVGMTVIADDTATGLSPRVGSTTVAGVDEDAGTVTLTSAAAITSFADSDYLFRAGDPGTCADGLALHFPLTAPTSGDSFRGADRSVDPRRLAGVRVNDTATSIEENAGLVAVKIKQGGKKADTVIWNPINFWQVARRLNAKVEFQGAGGKADYGFEFIAIHTPAGTLKAYADADCPVDRGWVGKLSALHLRHIDPYPHIIRDDGRPNLRQTSSDGLEARARCMSNSIVTEPGSWGVYAI